MKTFVYILGVAGILTVTSSCKKVLDKNPQATQTPDVFYSNSSQAVLGINGIYDAASWEEGPGAGSNLEWMYGDILSNDAEKGSTIPDFSAVQDMKTWSANPGNTPARDSYYNLYQTIYRANTAIASLQDVTWDADLKKRLLGEAHFLRGYAYFYLLRLFGGVSLVTTPLSTDEFNVPRSTFTATCELIESDLKYADSTLPLKSQYASTDAGRATKGAAEGYLARVYMYELGTVNAGNHTWQDVYNITNGIITSGEYGLLDNYAAIHQEESENGAESLFEIQYSESASDWGAVKVGTTNNVFQMSRATWGWGFNNPTQDLADEFEDNDPRRPCTLYGNGDIIVGVQQVVNYPAENFTGYLNSKAAIVQPAVVKASGQNIRKLRYADILLMQAEADAHLSNEAGARDILNTIRARARKSTRPKGAVLNNATIYAAANTPAGTLPDIASSVTGDALLQAIWHERRVELGMEAIHFWDMVRTGQYIKTLSSTVASACQSHCLTEATVNPVPVLPIPLTEVQAWKLQQNPNY